MERFSQRDSTLFDYNSLERSYTSTSTPKRNSDIDFHDVFGGPPRRSSIQEMRYSVSESQELSRGGQKEKEAASCPWPPVFGEENATRRRYPANDFYDDIFGGQESLPRKHHERDIFSAAASTRVLSPALPLPPSSSLPAHFSLPAKLTKGMDLPTFGSTTIRSLRYDNTNMKDNKDATFSNGFSSSSSESPTPHLSIVSSHVTQPKEVFNNDLRPPYRQSTLSQDLSESHNTTDKGKGGYLIRKKSSGSEVLPSCSDRFHFSIYKWASNGVPLVLPRRTDRNSRSKHKPNIHRCSSAKERVSSDSEITTQNDGALPYTDSGSFLTKKEDGSTSFTTQNGAELLQGNVEETTSAKPQSEASNSIQNIINDFAAINAFSNDTKVNNSSTHSAQEKGFSGKTKQDSIHAKPASKPLYSLFTENDKRGSDRDEIVNRESGKESKAKSTKKPFAIIDFPANQNKPLETVENKATSQGSNTSFNEKCQVQGKVKEFVRLLNQEASMKPRLDAKSPILGSEYKQRGALRTKKTVEDYPEQPEKGNCAIGPTNMSGNNLSQQDDISASAVPDNSVSAAGDKDGPFHVNFLVKELDQDEFEALEVQNNQEIQVIDAKIQQWSKGKEGNIRSLLSTLQYVLWPESGWKPVPLADIIEGNAVKRAYQRALLYLHPDKLQQKGAASHQKYIAEKTFEILQEAIAIKERSDLIPYYRQKCLFFHNFS